jgi:hypothetical protein
VQRLARQQPFSGAEGVRELARSHQATHRRELGVNRRCDGIAVRGIHNYLQKKGVDVNVHPDFSATGPRRPDSQAT